MIEKKLHIVFLDFDDVQNPLLGAGQAWATLEVGKLLVAKGHSVTVISSKFPGYKNRVEHGITYKHIGIGTKNIKINNLLYILSVPFIVSQLKADIIVECFTAPISTLLSPLWTSVPVIVLPSMFDAERFSKLYHLPFTQIEKYGSRVYKYFLPYSKEIEDKMKKLNPGIISKIVPEGVSADFLTIKRELPKHILFLGRFDISQKGIDLLLKAYAQIKDTVGYRLMIAGRGPDENRIKSLIKDLKLEHHVDMIGPTFGEEKKKILAQTLLVTFPSRTETFSLFALEALASGLPLVAFEIPGIAWMSRDVALKAKAFDTEQYAQLILRATDKQLNEQMSSAAREFAKHYTWEHVANEFESFFYEVLEKESKYYEDK